VRRSPASASTSHAPVIGGVLVTLTLGNVDTSTCLAGDANSDGGITVNEIVAGVNNALNGYSG